MKQLTKEQAIVIMGYTGISTISFDIFHEDVEKRLNRPVMTHEFASEFLVEKIKAVYKEDFLSLCSE